MATADSNATASYEKGIQLRKDGKIEEAIESFNFRPTNALGEVGKKCFDMYVELCLCEDNGKHVFDLDRSRVFGLVRRTQNVEQDTLFVVKTIFKHFTIMVERMEANVAKMKSSPTKEDTALAALSGVSIAERAKERYFEPCQRAAICVGRALLGPKGGNVSKKTFHIYLKTAVDFILLCSKQGLHEAAAKSSVNVCEMLKNLVFLTHENLPPRREHLWKDIEVNRSDFFKSESSGDATVRALCEILTVLAGQGTWVPSAWNVVFCLKNISDALFREKGLFNLRRDAYVKISEVFWSCKMTAYHAYCLGVATKQRSEGSSLPTRAVVAALICPDAKESQNPFAPNYDSHAVHDDVSTLFDEPETSRSDLLTALKNDGVVHRADPQVVSLIKAFEGEFAAHSTNFVALHEAVTHLIAKDESLKQYEGLLRQVLLCRQMELLASTTTRVDVQSLAMENAKVTEQQYLRDIEPAFLQDSSLPVKIDSKTKTVMFLDATRAKTLSSFEKLAGNLDTRHGVAASQVSRSTDGTMTSSSTNTVLAGITVNDLIAAQERTRLIHVLQSACNTSSATRKSDREKKIEADRDRATMERKAQEEKRRERVHAAEKAKSLAEYRERERQERSKAALTKVRQKYQHFKVDNSIALKSAAVFEDELTLALAAYKRREAQSDNRDTLRGNLFERAVRQLEIPKRKEMEQQNAEQHKAERAAARSNYLRQHREEYDRRHEERIELQKFLADAEEFEHKWSRVAETEKVSKRDEQEMLLEQEKRRLASQQ